MSSSLQGRTLTFGGNRDSETVLDRGEPFSVEQTEIFRMDEPHSASIPTVDQSHYSLRASLESMPVRVRRRSKRSGGTTSMWS